MALSMWKRRVRVDDNCRIGYDLNKVDRLSKLPEKLIRHIFSFLPTVDSVRTCVLSRKFRRVWFCVPALQFSDSDIFTHHQGFDEFVTQYLEDRHRAIRFLDNAQPLSFKLDAFVSEERSKRVTRWLSSSVMFRNIRELDLWLKCSNEFQYTLRLKSLRSLTCLKLHGGFNLSLTKRVKFPCLKYLSIEDVDFHTISIGGLLSKCPNLVTLSLVNVGTRAEVLILGSNLKSVVLKCKYLNVVIKAVNLESLVICCEELNSTIDFSSCTSIVDLTVNSVSRKFQSVFKDQVSKLDHLERLTLCFRQRLLVE